MGYATKWQIVTARRHRWLKQESVVALPERARPHLASIYRVADSEATRRVSILFGTSRWGK
jgi:hypothetical protein